VNAQQLQSTPLAMNADAVVVAAAAVVVAEAIASVVVVAAEVAEVDQVVDVRVPTAAQRRLQIQRQLQPRLQPRLQHQRVLHPRFSLDSQFILDEEIKP
jgi:hypothetical protein